MNNTHRMVVMPEHLAKRLLKQTGIDQKCASREESIKLLLSKEEEEETSENHQKEDSKELSATTSNAKINKEIAQGLAPPKRLKKDEESRSQEVVATTRVDSLSPFITHAESIEVDKQKIKDLISSSIEIGNDGAIIPKKRKKGPISNSNIDKIIEYLMTAESNGKKPRGTTWVLNSLKKHPEALNIIKNPKELAYLQLHPSHPVSNPIIPDRLLEWIPWPRS